MTLIITCTRDIAWDQWIHSLVPHDNVIESSQWYPPMRYHLAIQGFKSEVRVSMLLVWQYESSWSHPKSSEDETFFTSLINSESWFTEWQVSTITLWIHIYQRDCLNWSLTVTPLANIELHTKDDQSDDWLLIIKVMVHLKRRGKRWRVGKRWEWECERIVGERRKKLSANYGLHCNE